MAGPAERAGEAEGAAKVEDEAMGEGREEEGGGKSGPIRRVRDPPLHKLRFRGGDEGAEPMVVVILAPV